MTEQERQAKFLQVLAQARQLYGFTIQASVQMERLGDAYLSRPILQIIPVANWKPDNVEEDK